MSGILFLGIVIVSVVVISSLIERDKRRDAEEERRRRQREAPINPRGGGASNYEAGDIYQMDAALQEAYFTRNRERFTRESTEKRPSPLMPGLAAGAGVLGGAIIGDDITRSLEDNPLTDEVEEWMSDEFDVFSELEPGSDDNDLNDTDYADDDEFNETNL